VFIVDSQVHIWKEETPDRPWIKGARERMRLNGHREAAFTYTECVALMDSAGVDRALILLQGANAIHGALLTGAPMVICSGESTGYGDGAGPDPGSQWYRNLSVVGGPQGVAAPFTKWACAAADVNVLYGMVKRAGELANQAPAGPVYLNTPVETLLALPVVEPQSALCANFPRTSFLHAGGELAPLAAEADLVILLGCRAPWYPPTAKPGGATAAARGRLRERGRQPPGGGGQGARRERPRFRPRPG